MSTRNAGETAYVTVKAIQVSIFYIRSISNLKLLIAPYFLRLTLVCKVTYYINKNKLLKCMYHITFEKCLIKKNKLWNEDVATCIS